MTQTLKNYDCEYIACIAVHGHQGITVTVIVDLDLEGELAIYSSKVSLSMLHTHNGLLISS